jgi:hypothetical protein
MSTMRNRTITLLFLGLVLSCGLAEAQQAPALTPKNPIRLTNVEGRMDHLSIDVRGQRLFVTAFDNHTLEVIDLKTGRQVHTIPDLNEPQAPFYDAATNRLFVASGGDGTLKIYVLGEGFIDIWQQKDPDHYDRIGRVPTPADSRTGLFAPDLGDLFETIPHHGAQGAEIDVYGIQ